jgi:hypothetical protein
LFGTVLGGRVGKEQLCGSAPTRSRRRGVVQSYLALGDPPRADPQHLPNLDRRVHSLACVETFVLQEQWVEVVREDPAELHLGPEEPCELIVLQRRCPVEIDSCLGPRRLVEGSAVELSGLREVWRIEVRNNAVREECLVPGRDALQGVPPVTSPHVDEPVGFVQVAHVLKPLGQGIDVEATPDAVRRLLTAPADWAGPTVQDAREGGAVEEEALDGQIEVVGSPAARSVRMPGTPVVPALQGGGSTGGDVVGVLVADSVDQLVGSRGRDLPERGHKRVGISKEHPLDDAGPRETQRGRRAASEGLHQHVYLANLRRQARRLDQLTDDLCQPALGAGVPQRTLVPARCQWVSDLGCGLDPAGKLAYREGLGRFDVGGLSSGCDRLGWYGHDPHVLVLVASSPSFRFATRRRTSVPTPIGKAAFPCAAATGMIPSTYMDEPVPINVEPNYDQGHGWLGAADVITTTLNEFRKDVAARRRQRQSMG